MEREKAIENVRKTHDALPFLARQLSVFLTTD